MKGFYSNTEPIFLSKMKSFAVLVFLLVGLASFSQNKKDVKEADKLFKQEEYEQALPMYRKFINMDANNVDYVYKYGSCLVMVSEKVDEALQYLLKAEELGKKDEEIAYFIGRAYEKKKDFEKAMSYYERFMDSASKEQIKQLKVKKRHKNCKKALKKK